MGLGDFEGQEAPPLTLSRSFYEINYSAKLNALPDVPPAQQ